MNFSQRVKWLQALKVGDRVLIGTSLHTVSRITATQIILKENERRFRKRDGYRVGVGREWDHVSLSEPTELRLAEILEANKRRTLIYNLDCIIWRDQSTAILESLMEILNEASVPAPTTPMP